MNPSYINLKKLSEKNGEIEFEAEIPVETLEEYVVHEVEEAAVNFSMPGFRKGNAPLAVVREQVGEMELLEHAADGALREAMEEIVKDEKLKVLGRPSLIVTKMAPKNTLEFKIRYALFPEITLPDYKKIGKTIYELKEELAVTDQEVDEAIARIQTMIGSALGNAPTEDGKPAEVPPLTDESVKKFGPFESVEAFRTEIRKNIAQEKDSLAKDRKREEMVKQIVANSKVKVPHLLVEQEFEEFIENRNAQLASANLSLEEYVKQSGKTVEELEKEERRLIEEDMKTSLVIQEIRQKEELAPAEKDIQITIARLKNRYPDRKDAELRRTAEAMLLQEKLFALLEGVTPEIGIAATEENIPEIIEG